jgi:hypothetical protein
MADPPTGLSRPDAQTDRNRAPQEDSPTDPGRLPGKLDQRQEGKECQDSSGINEWSRNISTVGVLPKGGSPSLIQAGLDRAIHEGIIGGSTRLHDRRQHGGTEDHGQQSRGQGTTAVKDDADQNRQAGDGESDDRNMIQGDVEMGRREEGIHGCLERLNR